MLSLKICERLAEMLNMIEAGVVFLEKVGAAVGKVMSFRPLTITAPLYRCWATMRLEDLQGRISSWSLPEMHAGVPGMGAADALHEVLSSLELRKLKDQRYCGGVADIAKFVDQIVREIMICLVQAAGMPKGGLTAYKSFLQNLNVHNILAGGVGMPYQRRCGIP